MRGNFLILIAFILAAAFCNAQENDTIAKKIEPLSNVQFQLDNTTQEQEKQKNFLQHGVTLEKQWHVINIGGQTFKTFIYAVTKPSNPQLEDIFSRKRLYGPSQYDSRIEIAQLKPEVDWQQAIYSKSESVAMIVEKENLIKISPDIYQLNTAVTLKGRYKLCEGEAFANQIVVGCGTAFIIDKNSMMTAAHVFQRPLKNYAVVFGYRVINRLGTAETSIPSEDVYFPVEITKSYSDLDIVKFRTDREIKRPVLQWEKSKGLKNGSEIYMLGYPMGLPEKLTINADISDNSNFHYFYTSLDSFQGNSGSPVFNYETHKIIGVLVSGMADYELHGDCYKNSSCRQPDCIGEKVIRMEHVIE